jgi:hypothetical protein
MLLSGVLFVLFLAGCAITWLLARRNRQTNSRAYRRANRRSNRRPTSDATHLMIIDRSGGNVLWYPHPPTTTSESSADAALSRHPAGRSRPNRSRPGDTRSGDERSDGRGRSGRSLPRGPDDDPEFLRQLAQRIHGTPTDPAE